MSPAWQAGSSPLCRLGPECNWLPSPLAAVRNPPTKAGDVGLVPGSGRSPGGGNGSPLWYSSLGNPMDWGTWESTVHEGHKRIRYDRATKQQLLAKIQSINSVPDTIHVYYTRNSSHRNSWKWLLLLFPFYK